MAQARVAILDASSTLFPVDDRSLPPPAVHESDLTLKPIPDFRDIVTAACKDVTGKVARSKIAPVDVGVICDSTAVRNVARALHERVLRKLKEVAVKTEPT